MSKEKKQIEKEDLIPQMFMQKIGNKLEKTLLNLKKIEE